MNPNAATPKGNVCPTVRAKPAVKTAAAEAAVYAQMVASVWTVRPVSVRRGAPEPLLSKRTAQRAIVVSLVQTVWWATKVPIVCCPVFLHAMANYAAMMAVVERAESALLMERAKRGAPAPVHPNAQKMTWRSLWIVPRKIVLLVAFHAPFWKDWRSVACVFRNASTAT